MPTVIALTVHLGFATASRKVWPPLGVQEITLLSRDAV